MDFQSMAAPLVVLVTVAIMVYAKWRKKSGCGGCCPSSKSDSNPSDAQIKK